MSPSASVISLKAHTCDFYSCDGASHCLRMLAQLKDYRLGWLFINLFNFLPGFLFWQPVVLQKFSLFGLIFKIVSWAIVCEEQCEMKWVVFKHEYFQSLYLDLNCVTTKVKEESYSEETPLALLSKAQRNNLNVRWFSKFSRIFKLLMPTMRCQGSLTTLLPFPSGWPNMCQALSQVSRSHKGTSAGPKLGVQIDTKK